LFGVSHYDRLYSLKKKKLTWPNNCADVDSKSLSAEYQVDE